MSEQWERDNLEIIMRGSQGQREVVVRIMPTWGGYAEHERAARIMIAVNSHEEMKAALQSFLVRMERCGEYDDGCFYYAKTAASELEEPIRLAKAALAKVQS